MIENHLTASRKCGMIAKKVKKVNQLRRRFLLEQFGWNGALSADCAGMNNPGFLTDKKFTK